MPALRFGMAPRMAARGGFPSCAARPSWSCPGEAAVAAGGARTPETLRRTPATLRRTPATQRIPPFPQIRVHKDHPHRRDADAPRVPATGAVTALDRRKRLRRTPATQRIPPFPQTRIQNGDAAGARIPSRTHLRRNPFLPVLRAPVVHRHILTRAGRDSRGRRCEKGFTHQPPPTPCRRCASAWHPAWLPAGGFPSCRSCPVVPAAVRPRWPQAALERRKRYAGRRQRSESHLFPKYEFSKSIRTGGTPMLPACPPRVP
jgi:hypothetical protein